MLVAVLSACEPESGACAAHRRSPMHRSIAVASGRRIHFLLDEGHALLLLHGQGHARRLGIAQLHGAHDQGMDSRCINGRLLLS